MKKTLLLLKFIQHIEQKKAKIKLSASQDDTGFTLIELLVVIIIIGVLAAAAAPSWIGFINQRRASSANELVFRSLQEAQSMAKSKKMSYSVSFKNNGVPEIAVYQTKKSDGSFNAPYDWRSFQKELNLRPGQITLGTNLDGENKKKSSIDYNLNSNNNNKKITFDHLGTLQPGQGSATADTGLIVVVGVPKDNQAIESTKRCVKVVTLLGALKIDRTSNCSN